MAFLRMLVVAAIACVVGSFFVEEKPVPIEVQIDAIQNGSLGSEGAKDNVFVLGVADDRLIAGSSLQWLRFGVITMGGDPTGGTWGVTISVGSALADTGPMEWDATPWEVAQSITAALDVAGIVGAVVPIDISGLPSSSASIAYEVRTPSDPNTWVFSPYGIDLVGGNYSSGGTIQSASGTPPSQAGNAHFYFEWPTPVDVGGETDTQIQSGHFDLSDAQDNSSDLGLKLDDLFGSGLGTVEVYAESASHTWYKITLPGTAGLSLHTTGGATDIALWQVQESDGSIGDPEKQEVSIPDAVGGNFTLTVSNTGGTAFDTTDPIAFDATADDVRDAIRAMSFEPALRGAMVRCVGGPLPDTAVRVVFSPFDGNVPLMVANSSGLNSLASPSIDIVPHSLVTPLGDVLAVEVTPQALRSSLQLARTEIVPQPLREVIQSIPSVEIVPQALDGTPRVTSAPIEVVPQPLSSSTNLASVSVTPLGLASPLGSVLNVDVIPQTLRSSLGKLTVEIIPLALQPRIPRHVRFGVFTVKKSGVMSSLNILKAGKTR